MKLYVPGVNPVKSKGDVTTGSVLNVPCVHCPPESSLSNNENKSKSVGKLDSQ